MSVYEEDDLIERRFKLESYFQNKPELIDKIVAKQKELIKILEENEKIGIVTDDKYFDEFKTALESLDLDRLNQYYQNVDRIYEKIYTEKKEKKEKEEKDLYSEILDKYIFHIVPDLKDKIDVFMDNSSMKDINFSDLDNTPILREISSRDEDESNRLGNVSVIEARRIDLSHVPYCLHGKEKMIYLINDYFKKIVDCQFELGYLEQLPEKEFFDEFLGKVSGLTPEYMHKTLSVLHNIDLKKQAELEDKKTKEQDTTLQGLYDQLEELTGIKPTEINEHQIPPHIQPDGFTSQNNWNTAFHPYWPPGVREISPSERHNISELEIFIKDETDEPAKKR